MKAENRMKIIRTAILVGKATVFVVGLSVILAAIFGVASMAFAANGKPFLLGRTNFETAVSKLTNRGEGPALSLNVKRGKPPMAVNSSRKVANLNADKLDGKDASRFATKPSEGWHEIGAAGEPKFWGGWSNATPPYICSVQSPGCPEYNTAGFYKDSLGIVHLKGSIKLDLGNCPAGVCSSIAFRLPPGYRTAKAAVFNPASDRGGIFVLYDGYFQLDIPGGLSGVYNFSLDGITFRAQR
jgi:hypothetical protein